MNRYCIGHGIVVTLLIGAAFALIIVPGNSLVLMGTGIVVGFSALVLFAQDFGGHWLWPFGRQASGKALATAPSIGQRQSSRVCK
jgi:hypothetical protein